ncbi:putative complement C4 [Triplophysa rosa]|uniref:Complement C4 n=1 Tax=Triplophysa rosa TaxID=992332 RepID=A0A9W7WQL1_TRIRA|nr:putative complement C4 [Triplophysa rosa]
MDIQMSPLLCLLVYMTCVVHGDNTHRFLITAPSVFHVGVKERISVQVGETLHDKTVSCRLETEMRVPMSASQSKTITGKGQVKTMDLEIYANEVSNLKSTINGPPYLNLACDVGGVKRMARVLVSQHSGYIFIQTDQPIYNPSEKVRFRIFTLDHSMRPKSDYVHVSVFNADGNRIKKMMVKVDGIFSKNFHIPDVSKPGVWRITAHYKGDEKNPAVREFKVQQFVLPSFGVSIQPATGFLLVNETFTFTIQALYTYGKTIDGGFHCRFGIKEEKSENKGQEIKFLGGLEQMGSVKKGKAEVAVKSSDLKSKLKNLTLEDLAETQSQFYIAVTVTDILSGEVQESEVFLPIVQSPFIVDLSRTRLYYTPGFPIEVVVTVHHPNGSPAKHVQVHLDVSSTDKNSISIKTNGDGIASYAFNLIETPPSISVKATVDGVKETLVVRRISSSGNSFLYMSATTKVLSQGESIEVMLHVSGNPEDRQIHYMTLSRGSLREARSVDSSSLVKIHILITPEMIPSFRLIGFYYNTGGDIIADSVWVDVKDTCGGKLEVKLRDDHQHQPGDSADLEVDVGNQEDATVALLVVDKGIYALGTQNKLILKQVFASMQSYDLGCSYGGGENTAAVFNDAGLAFISHSTTVRSMMRKGFSCKSGFRRNKRSIDVQAEMARKEAAFDMEQQRKCCRHGFTQIPMRLTCEDRAKRVSKLENKDCVDAFRECCEFATKLRDKKRREDLKKGHARTANANEIEELFDDEVQTIRRHFPPSFDFREIKAKGKFGYKIYIPDSITTYEIQAVSTSISHGFCVAEPVDLRVFKALFLSLRLPYSVKRFEQLTIVVVIFNYGKMDYELIVRMREVEGLCSPGTSSYVTIHLDPESSQTVTFSAVPMVTGEIPIIIELYDAEDRKQVDAIQKMLLVKNEGVEIRSEQTYVINLDGRSDQNVLINGVFPNNTVPETDVNLFVKLEEDGFGQSTAAQLLSPIKVENLIMEPTGCGEQTMIRMSPTALSIHYLDKINGWLELEAGSRDKALDFIEKGYERILTFKKPDGSYAAWIDRPTSTWLTALVVKVLSLVADRQIETKQQNGLTEKEISQEEIRKSVLYLIKTQSSDGSFTDSNPVIHREMQGGVGGVEQDASLTAFITIALCRSLPFLDKETADVRNSISRATDFLLARVKDLKRPYALAITAYCLSTCLTDQTPAISAWEKLKSKAKKVTQNECLVWGNEDTMRLENEARGYLVPSGVALTIESTAYALLTALKHKDLETARRAACFLSSQENYEGGFKSTQDTIVALEALSEYRLSIPEPPITSINAQFTVTGRSETEKLLFDNNEKGVEAELKRLLGNNINAKFSGKGKVQMKVAKAYYAFKEDTNCADVSINVTVTGKVQYTKRIQENYDYYDYENEEETKEEEDFPRTNIEWFDARSRRRRDTAQNNQHDVIYEVCVSHAQGRNLSGMAIADITLLSGFVAVDADLEKLKTLVDSYISHYETTKGRVLLYFNEIEADGMCLAFGAEQDVPIGLIQPAPATFYDYYEPDRRCSVLYSAPKRSKMVSILCSDDVCQCAEKGCFTERKTFEMKIYKKDRFEYVCYRYHVDYALEVSVERADEEGSFILYSTTVNEVLRYNEDQAVKPGSSRVFVKRKHCKSELKVGNTYLIMGNDGRTKDLDGSMKYLLDSKTWVEQKPTNSTCLASVNKQFCLGFKKFMKEYQVDGCDV